MIRLATSAMATRFELVLVVPGDPRGRARARAAGEAALAAIERCDGEWSAFASDSFLAYLNRAAASRPVSLDADQLELLGVCDDVARASGGAFDPSVAPLICALDRRAELEPAAARERVGWGAVRLDRERRTLRFTRAGVALDLGGIAKGHALELAARELRAAGIEGALLHGGTSSVVALGAPPAASAWRVALEGGPGAPVVELRDAALSVSAQHGRTLADGSGHVLDPRTRASVASDATVAVVHANARVAEAWSTALLVLGGPSLAPPGLDVALGRGPRGARTWQYTHPPVSAFAQLATVHP